MQNSNAICFSKVFIAEFAIVIISCLLAFLVIGTRESKINADAKGYYDYLPSILIHNDINRKDITIPEDTSGIYDRIFRKGGVYQNYKDYKVNRHPFGASLLISPFFITTCLTTDLNGDIDDGYQPRFHTMVMIAAVFYLFLSLIALKYLLKLYEINRWLIILIQMVTVFGTPVFYYTFFEPGYSHIYSLFAITSFFYFIKSYFKYHKLSHIILGSVFLGLLVSIRQANGLIIFSIPFIAGSFPVLMNGIRLLLKKYLILVISVLIVFGFILIQCLFWYLQTGDYLLYSYPGQGFNFLSPQIINVLFSYRKGLFIYTPVLFLALISTIYWIRKKRYFSFFSWMIFFFIFTYFTSSWWCWHYGASFGMRPFIDLFAFFFIPLALVLDNLKIKIKIALILLVSLSIPVNMIQTYQYKEFIIDWSKMDKRKYRNIFLKTDDRFKAVVTKRKIYPYQTTLIKRYTPGDYHLEKNKYHDLLNILSSEIREFEKINLVSVSFENDIKAAEEAVVILSIKDTANQKAYYWLGPKILRFLEEDFGQWQTGVFNYRFEPMTDEKIKRIKLTVKTEDTDLELKNLQVEFFRYK